MIYDTAIVGAGIAGLTCARTLTARNHSVLVLERDRQVGGRLSTRSFGGAIADTAAQFMTVRDSEFEQIISEVPSAVRRWTTGYVSDEGFLSPDGEVRYRGHPSMQAFAEALSERVTVECNTVVTGLSLGDEYWEIYTGSGSRNPVRAQELVLTAPVPETLDLLRGSRIPIGADAQAVLESVVYEPCIAIVAVSDEPHPVPGPGAVHMGHGPIRWVADNFRKGISPDRHALTIHASGEWSSEHFEDTDEQIVSEIAGALSQWLALEPESTFVERWRYARVVGRDRGDDERRAVSLGTPLPCVVAGDGLSGARVEAAALSGIAAARTLLS